MSQNARTTDPVSSHLAGDDIESSGIAGNQRRLVLALVKNYPNKTSHELALHSHLDRYQIARRLPEIHLIEKGPVRTCAVSKRTCVTWRMKTELSHVSNWIDKVLEKMER